MSVKTVKNKPRIYGLTGGIASGKSTAANFFNSKGLKVFDADAYVKNIWENNLKLIEQVNDKYKIDIKTEEGKKTLSNIIFNNEFERFYLNSLVHPLVFAEIDKFITKNKDESLLIIDMPLLFEVGYDSKVDKTILIYTTPKIQKNRLISRDKINKEEAERKISAQISLKEKRGMSHYIVNNDKTINDLMKRLELLYEVIINESKQ